MWSFNKPEKIKNTDKYRVNTFGFYSINGSSIMEFHEHSRKGDVCEFLESIRNSNPHKTIMIIPDNFASHRSADVQKKAEELNIKLIFLPPYSPDLNPIEFLWKSIKRIISKTLIASEYCTSGMKQLIQAHRNRMATWNHASGDSRKTTYIPGNS